MKDVVEVLEFLDGYYTVDSDNNKIGEITSKHQISGYSILSRLELEFPNNRDLESIAEGWLLYHAPRYYIPKEFWEQFYFLFGDNNGSDRYTRYHSY